MSIRNDATRQRIRQADPRVSRAVVPRQGQALLDADLDQQQRYSLARIEAETADILGEPGRLVVPAGSPAFAITADTSPSACGIGAGRGYLDGWLVDNPTACTLAAQPHPRTDTATTPYAMVLKSLVRHVDPVEENAYADPALGDAQAAGRALVDWQVFPFSPTAIGSSPGCAAVTTHADWSKLVAPSTGTLAVVADSAPPSSDPCSLAPAGGYSRAENLCYRIEVDGGTPRTDFPTVDGPRLGLAGLRLKLSRRNASVMARIVSVSGTEVTVEPPTLDPHNWFAPGLYAELVSSHDDVDPRDASSTTRLFQVNHATDSVVTLEAAAASTVTGKTGWFLRLWDGFADGQGTATVTTTSSAPDVSQHIDLGDGVKILLGAGAGGAGTATFRRGDYWTFAARSDGTLDWPAGGTHETPHGPETRYAPLAVLTGSPPAAGDCRISSATLTDRTLLYRGGDGQSVMPPPGTSGFVTLPSMPRVAVMRGRAPVAGARVRWSVPASAPATHVDGQSLSGAGTLERTTGTDGICQVPWALGRQALAVAHKLQVTLLDADGNPEGPALVFTAQFATAAGTSYQPGACDLLSQAATMQEALDTLCKNLGGGSVEEPETLSVTSIVLVGREGETQLLGEENILNGIELPHTAFEQGIGVGISGNSLECTPETHDPIIEVELDLPYPTTDPDRWYWSWASQNPRSGANIQSFFGVQRVRLDGEVRVLRDEGEEPFQPGLLWHPSESAQAFLDTVPTHRFGYALSENIEFEWSFEEQPRVLCRLRVRSAHVWAQGERSRQAWLNAEYLGSSRGVTNRELLTGERDPQRAADLAMFFYLKLPDE
jgi:hypothetical protein